MAPDVLEQLYSVEPEQFVAERKRLERSLRGEGRAEEAAMEESTRAFAPDFRRVAPDGRVQGRGEVIAMLRQARGTRERGFAIRVEVREARSLDADLALVLYDEHQVEGGAARPSRRASALLGLDARAPGGVAWRHLQETWIDPAPG